MNMIPSSRPRMTFGEMAGRVRQDAGIELLHTPLLVVGIRGYYKDTMGLPGVNDRGIYDDAIFVCSTDSLVAYNGNCDPSRVRKGSGFGAGKGMASLKPGLYHAHRCGLHKGKYEALIQIAGPVTVTRDGNPPYDETGMFGINIHRGGFNTTGSEGCQTIHPSQYASFIANVHDQVKRIAGKSWRSYTVPYLLMDN